MNSVWLWDYSVSNEGSSAQRHCAWNIGVEVEVKDVDFS